MQIRSDPTSILFRPRHHHIISVFLPFWWELSEKQLLASSVIVLQTNLSKSVEYVAPMNGAYRTQQVAPRWAHHLLAHNLCHKSSEQKPAAVPSREKPCIDVTDAKPPWRVTCDERVLNASWKADLSFGQFVNTEESGQRIMSSI